MYDLLIKGGEVIDPSQNLSARRDIAITGGKIAALEEEISPHLADRVVDAGGKKVTPGLIDLHAHLGWPIHEQGVPIDPTCAQAGVTTAVDAGSSGAFTFAWYRREIERAEARLIPFLNICAIGCIAVHTPFYIASAIEYADVEEAVRAVEGNRDLIGGIKAFTGANMLQHSIENLKRAREAADRADLPLMVHISAAPPPVSEVVPYLREGDILTHCFTFHTQRILAPSGQLWPEVEEAWERGIILDIGHGAGSFNFWIAEAMLAQGLKPDCISTDLHSGSYPHPVYDLPTTLSKFLCLGMSLEEVIEAATMRPAQALRREGELGTLRVGAEGDVALFELEEGEFEFYDAQGNRRVGTERLVNTLTVRGGKVMAR